jgi:hypothetical protein
LFSNKNSNKNIKNILKIHFRGYWKSTFHTGIPLFLGKKVIVVASWKIFGGESLQNGGLGILQK